MKPKTTTQRSPSPADGNGNGPSLNFFLLVPPELAERPPLASSLQNFEQTLELISLRRFPGALASCATAWEGVLKAWLRKAPDRDAGLEELLDEAWGNSPALRSFSKSKLAAFRKTRNRILHYGHSPKDDDECARLLLEAGLPFLKACYAHLFDIHLDWHDIRPGAENFMQLTTEERNKAALLPDVADHLRIAGEAFAQSRWINPNSASLCFRVLEHWMHRGWRAMWVGDAESQVLARADGDGEAFDIHEQRKERARKLFAHVAWEFDCPICNEHGAVVGELDNGGLDSKVVRLRSCVCVACDLVVPRTAVRLADVLLKKQLEQQKPKILKEFGIT